MSTALMSQPSTQHLTKIRHNSNQRRHGTPCAPAGVNFALFAQHAKRVTLCLYDEASDSVSEYPLDPGSQRSGDVWHVCLEGLPGSNVLYGFKVAGDGSWETGHRWVRWRG
jgi:isoamylase